MRNKNMSGVSQASEHSVLVSTKCFNYVDIYKYKTTTLLRAEIIYLFSRHTAVCLVHISYGNVGSSVTVLGSSVAMVTLTVCEQCPCSDPSVQVP